jgi:drug/metabolite transporter (DMT)-like permease
VTAIAGTVDVTRRTNAELGLVASAIAVVAWGVGPLFVRAIGVSTPTTVVHRFAFGAPTMTAAAYLFGAPLTLRLFRRALVPGMIWGLSMFLGFGAVLNTSVANATLIGNLMPVIVVLVARFAYNERVRARQFLAVAVALAGIALVVFGSDGSGDASLRGDAMAFANVLMFTVFFLRMKRLRDEGIESWSLLAAVTIVAAAVAIPIGVVWSNDLGAVDGRDWLYVGAIVLVPGVLGHGLMTWAQKHLAVTVSSLMTLASPVVSAIGAWLWLEQSMSAIQGLGAGIVIAALASIAINARVEAVRAATLSDLVE